MKNLILLLLVISLNLKAQSKVDSLVQLGHYQEAVALLEQENNAISKRELAKLYNKIGKVKKAYNTLNTITTKSIADSIYLGRLQLKLGDEQGVFALEKIYQNHPDNLLLGLELANYHYKKETFKKASDYYKELVKKDTSNSYFQYRLGRSLEKNRSYIPAVKAYKKAIALDTEAHQSMYHLSNHYMILKVKDSALFYINNALKIKPKKIAYLKRKVLLLYKNALFDESIQEAKKIIKLDKGNAFAYNSLGLAFYNKKELDSAVNYQIKTLILSRGNAEYTKNLALIFEAKKDYKRAKIFFKASIEALEQDTYSQLYHLGLIALQEQKTKKAITYFTKAYNNNKRFYGSLYILALSEESYYKDKTIALKHFEEYIEKFEKSDAEKTIFVKAKIKSLKETLFFETGRKP
jgi:tetratricopeptide (TPR) repeat protein